jgi:hypothetical protein
VFRLAAVLLYTLTRRPPFFQTRLRQVLDGDGEQAPDLRGVPEPLAPILRRALARDPLGRPASAGDLRVALEAALPALEAEGG